MLNFITSSFHFLKSKNWKSYALPVKASIIVFLLSCFVLSNTFGQAGDLSQIRNGSGKVQNSVLDTCGKCWVNGNAGASNAHYVEGMSIAYRSLITGLTVGTCYEYEMGYDTYHGAFAIDYLTHFQRLEPHQPFGHIAEVIDPTFFVSGSSQYHMTIVDAGPHTFDIPAPAAFGITSGAFNADGSTKNISNQPVTSFTALPTAQKKFTAYNATIENFIYVSQPAPTIGGADKETRVRIRFTALSDSVVLAWGGHIASRLDYGYSKDSKGKLTPLSAGGISGSPYHMRQKAFDRVDCGFNTDHVLQSFSGFGNQDRSLSAAAVVPPPECPTTSGNQTICLGGSFSAFSITNAVAGTTYEWSFASNTANAAFSTGTATVTGTSVTIVAGSGGFTAGSFTLSIKATLNSIDLTCAGPTGTINAAPDAPIVTYNAPSCTQTTFSITVSGIQTGDAVTVKDKNNSTISGLSPASPYTVVSGDGGTKTFTGIPAGSGYIVSVSRNGCTSDTTDCGVSGGAIARASTTNIEMPASPTNVKAYPNPFSDKLKFVVTSGVAGRGSLEVYNMMGQKVKTVYQGYIQAGTQTFEMSLPTQQIANLVYVLRVNDQKVTGKVLQINQ
jgi:hypothetical protein